MCVLVVDDEPLILELMSEALQDAGHEVIGVGSGFEALDVLASPPRPLSALVTDFHMPGLVDGEELAAQARRAFPTIPVVIVSGRHDVLRGSWRDELGYALLSKPFALSAMVAAVQERIGRGVA